MELGDNEAHIFQIPIPEELSSVGEDYDILIEITLSYAANPRIVAAAIMHSPASPKRDRFICAAILPPM